MNVYIFFGCVGLYNVAGLSRRCRDEVAITRKESCGFETFPLYRSPRLPLGCFRALGLECDMFRPILPYEPFGS